MPQLTAHRLVSALAVPLVSALVGLTAQAGMSATQWAGGLLAAVGAVLWAALAFSSPRA